MPHVIAVRVGLEPAVTLDFALKFWHNIAARQEPPLALANALAACPPLVRQHVACRLR